MMQNRKIPFGVITPLTTPFADSGELQPGLLRGQVEFLLANGADSLAVGGSTGEGQTLSGEELRALVSEVKEAANADTPIVASVIVNSTRQALQMVQTVADLDVDAIQMTPVHYIFRPDDDMMVEHFRVLFEETRIPIIIYNVVPWTYLSPELAVRIMEEVPGVLGIKQSAGDLKLFADLMTMAPAGRQIYSAVDALMYPSFCLGAPGVIAATPAGIPQVVARLRDCVRDGDHASALKLHTATLKVWNAMDTYNLPACIRHLQELQGVKAGLPRRPMRPATEHQREAMGLALREALALCESLKN